jgi:hypothetical protein
MSYKRIQEVRKPLKQKEEKDDENLNISTTLQNPNTDDAEANSDTFVAQNTENTTEQTKTTKKIKPITTTVNSNNVIKSYADPCTFAIAAKRCNLLPPPFPRYFI